MAIVPIHYNIPTGILNPEGLGFISYEVWAHIIIIFDIEPQIVLEIIQKLVGFLYKIQYA